MSTATEFDASDGTRIGTPNIKNSLTKENEMDSKTEVPTASLQDCVNACPSLEYAEWFAESLHSAFLFYHAANLGLFEDGEVAEEFEYKAWQQRYAGVWLEAFEKHMESVNLDDYDEDDRDSVFEYGQEAAQEAAWDAAQAYFEKVGE